MERPRVMLVDDDEDLLEVCRIVLEAAGFEVVTATGSEQALRLAATVPLAAAVLDVMMATPDEGFELARSLRRSPDTRGIPLVMLTSVNAVNASQGFGFHFSDADRDEVWLPVDSFLDKPVKPEALVATLRAVMG